MKKIRRFDIPYFGIVQCDKLDNCINQYINSPICIQNKQRKKLKPKDWFEMKPIQTLEEKEEKKNV